MNLNKTLNTLELHAKEIAAKLKKGAKVSNDELKILASYNALQKAFEKNNRIK